MSKVRLGDVAEVITKGTTPTSIGYDFQNSGINYIKIESIAENGCFLKDKFAHISVECNESLKRSQLRCNDLLFSIAGDIGRVAIVDDSILPANTNQALAIIRIPEGIINYNYLYYFLKSEAVIKQYSRKKQGVAQINLSLKNISDLIISVPSLSQQNKIVKTLSFLDELINKANQQKVKMDELIKSRFVEMFGDANNSFEYPIISIKDTTDVQVGVVIKPAQYYTNEEDGVRAFRGLNIGEMYIKNDEWVYFSEEGQKKNSKSILHENDIVIVRSGSPGTACVITKQYEGYYAVDIIIARPNIEKVNPYYLCAYTNYPHGRNQIEDGIGGAAQKHFKISKYKEMKLIYPPIDLQNQFADFVTKVEKQKTAVQKSKEKLETLKKSLMQEYFG